MIFEVLFYMDGMMIGFYLQKTRRTSRVKFIYKGLELDFNLALITEVLNLLIMSR